MESWVLTTKMICFCRSWYKEVLAVFGIEVINVKLFCIMSDVYIFMILAVIDTPNKACQSH